MGTSGHPSSYLTLARDAEARTEVRRSVFLATVARVGTEPEARAVLAQLQREHRDARHHCSAFVLDADAAVQRSSDDGEPAGTAGAPMLEALRGAEVSDVVAVVTRWFGGVLLGAGGLARAYGDAVRAALAEAGTLRRRLLVEHTVTLDHAAAGRVESELRARGVQVLDAAYGPDVRLVLGVPEAGSERLAVTLAELTGGRVRPQRTGQRWVDDSGVAFDA